MKRLQLAFLQLGFGLLAFVSCVADTTDREAQLSPDHRIKVIASTPILADWIQEIGGERVSVTSIIPHSTNPHSYRPGAKDIANITQSVAVFSVGLSYEDTWLTKLLSNHNQLKQVVLGEMISPIGIRHQENENMDDDHHQEKEKMDDDHHQENENMDDDHSHQHRSEFDPHFWFDPSRVVIATKGIAVSLSTMDPEGEPYYMERFRKYRTDLNQLDKEISEAFANLPFDRKIVMTEHESLRYLGDRYQIEILDSIIPSVDSTTGTTPKDLAAAINTVRDQEIRVIFVENESVGSFAAQVARETGVTIATGLTVETLALDQTYIEFMQSNLDVLIGNLSQ